MFTSSFQIAPCLTSHSHSRYRFSAHRVNWGYFLADYGAFLCLSLSILEALLPFRPFIKTVGRLYPFLRFLADFLAHKTVRGREAFWLSI